MQHLIVGLIVTACALQAAWVLMPAALRRRLAARALHLRWPAPLQRRLETLARTAPGCGCDGCDAGTSPGAPKPGEARPIRFMRKPTA